MPSPLPSTIAPETQPERRYFASMGFGSEKTELSKEFAEAMIGLEKSLGMPLWFLIQDGSEHDMCRHIEVGFFNARHELPKHKPIALLVESPGGRADVAYGIAKLIKRQCGSFVVIVAQWAKSAATLLSLGASEILLAEHAQLGPLDAQYNDLDRESTTSALDETQSLERLHAAALDALDKTVLLLAQRTGKRLETITPQAMKFTADLLRPLFEKVDVVQYTNRQRTLKVAEEYAVRLLRTQYHMDQAKAIARRLVYMYPEHGFVIDCDEARDIGLNIREPTVEQAQFLDKITPLLESMNACGRVVER